MKKKAIELVRKFEVESEAFAVPFVYRALSASHTQTAKTDRRPAQVIKILSPSAPLPESSTPVSEHEPATEPIEITCRLLEDPPTSIFLDVVA